MSSTEIIDTGYAVPLDHPLGVASEISAPQSAVSWGAVFAGGVTAAAISIILLVFGTGLGLASRLALGRFRRVGHDLYRVGGDLADHRAMGVFVLRRVHGRKAAHEMGGGAYR